MKPSPGPWRWDDDGMEASLVDSAGVSFLRSDGDIKSDNATLIASAPEMREMLLKLEGAMMQDFCAWCSETEHSPKDCEFAALLERIR